MNNIKEMKSTSLIYSSKLDLYKAELIQVNNNIYKSTAKKRELESLINGELPTLMEMVNRKKKADERDNEDLESLIKQVASVDVTQILEEEKQLTDSNVKFKTVRKKYPKSIKDEALQLVRLMHEVNLLILKVFQLKI